MKNLNVIFQHDRLYDTTTGKRVILREGAEFALLGDNHGFLEDDGVNNPPKKVLNSNEKEEEVTTKENVKQCIKLLDSGTFLCFENGHKARKNSDEKARRHRFTVELLEDLYLYKSSTGSIQAFGCHCVAKQVKPDIRFFEPIYGTSLNNLFQKVSVFYFPHLRSPSGSSFNEYEVYDPYTNKIGKSLDELRAEAVKKLDKQ